MSGYDIKKAIEQSLSNFWNESYGQIYPILKRLAAEGLATTSVEKQAGKPERYVYALTDKGRNALQRWLREPPAWEVGRIEILLKLFFGQHAAMADNVRHLQRFRKLQSQLLQRYKAIEGRLKGDYAKNPHLPYWLMTVSYGRQISQARIHWCDDTLATLREMAEKMRAERNKGKREYKKRRTENVKR